MKTNTMSKLQTVSAIEDLYRLAAAADRQVKRRHYKRARQILSDMAAHALAVRQKTVEVHAATWRAVDDLEKQIDVFVREAGVKLDALEQDILKFNAGTGGAACPSPRRLLRLVPPPDAE